MKELLISLTASFLLALFAYLKKAMTNVALVVAFIFAFLITYFGGISCFIILTVVFLSTVIVHKIKANERKKINENSIEKSGKKDVYQIIANVFLSVVALTLYKITNDNIWVVVYASVMAEAIADSIASDIGVLSKTEPINILTLKRGISGLSGNISLLGTTASLIASFVIAIIYFIFIKQSILHLIVITLSGFIGGLIDSLLGALTQVKYECQICHQITEKKSHCKRHTTYKSGIKWINNDMVNLLSNLASGIITYLIL